MAHSHRRGQHASAGLSGSRADLLIGLIDCCSACVYVCQVNAFALCFYNWNMDYKWNMKTVNLYMSTISAYISVRLILYRVNKDV